MLASVEPYLDRSTGDPEIIELLAVEGLPERAIFDVGKARDRRYQLVVTLHRVRREIGEPDAVGIGRDPDRQDAVFVVGVDPLPILAVIGHAGAIALPSMRVGRARA